MMACILPATIRERFCRDYPWPLERKGEAFIPRIWIPPPAVGAEVVEAAQDAMIARRYTEAVDVAAPLVEALDMAADSTDCSLVLGNGLTLKFDTRPCS